MLKDNVAYFGYGYIKDVNELVPNVPLTFYMFRVMVMLGWYFILFFIVVLFLALVGSISWMAHGWRPHSATTHPACPAR